MPINSHQIVKLFSLPDAGGMRRKTNNILKNKKITSTLWKKQLNTSLHTGVGQPWNIIFHFRQQIPRRPPFKRGPKEYPLLLLWKSRGLSRHTSERCSSCSLLVASALAASTRHSHSLPPGDGLLGWRAEEFTHAWGLPLGPDALQFLLSL